MPKLYQSGFTLIWNLQTGSYTTLDVDDLVEISQKEFYRCGELHLRPSPHWMRTRKFAGNSFDGACVQCGLGLYLAARPM